MKINQLVKLIEAVLAMAKSEDVIKVARSVGRPPGSTNRKAKKLPKQKLNKKNIAPADDDETDDDE